MRALLQRVDRASVSLPSGEKRSIGRGLLIYLGVGQSDSPAAVKKLVEKVLNLRIFSNDQGKFDRSVHDERGEILVISQFTLFGEAKGGRRPDFTSAASPEKAKPLYAGFALLLRESGLEVRTGEFASKMSVESVNDGPVTIWLDTDRF